MMLGQIVRQFVVLKIWKISNEPNPFELVMKYRRNFGKNFQDDTDLLFLSGFPVWAKL